MAFETRDGEAVELDIVAVPVPISGLKSEALLVIANDSIDAPEERISDCGLGRGILGRKPADDSWTVRYLPEQTTVEPASLRVLERTRYQIRLCSRDDRNLISTTDLPSEKHLPEDLVDSSLKNARLAEWRFDAKSGTGEMAVKGHYGGASIRVLDREIRLDFVSADLDYESEYRAMLEEIVGHFESIIANWGGPTTYPTTRSDDATADTLLEQFVLARGLLESHQLEYAARAIERNPSMLLEHSEHWKPLANADPQSFLQDPISKGRGWRQTDEDRFPVDHMPEEVKHARKQETADTLVNRFVKHVLQRFEDIFRRVAQNDEISGSANLEASGLANDLAKVIDQPFWKEIGTLSRPLATVTGAPLLRKREGYRQVFRAWLGLRSSLSVDWEGASNLFQGPVRKTHKLYEYWLFFILRDCLGGMNGLEEKAVKDSGDVKALIRKEGDRLAVRLSGGKTSVTEFRGSPSESQELCILLFYNRGFSRAPEHPGWGSYSRGWRPDFSIAVFPSQYRSDGDGWKEAEKLACKEKDAAYVHFEAKYKPSSSSKAGGREPSPTASDFAELHAYLDGIRGSETAFLIHPGGMNSANGIQNSYSRGGLTDQVGEAVLRPGPVDSSGTHDGVQEDDATFVTEIIRNVVEQFFRT